MKAFLAELLRQCKLPAILLGLLAAVVLTLFGLVLLAAATSVWVLLLVVPILTICIALGNMAIDRVKL